MTTAAESRTERIEAQLKGIPAKPGVYLFRDAKDTVLYVGKAKSLRSRVRSYFRGGDARPGLEQLIERVERIEVIVTSTEAEALPPRAEPDQAPPAAVQRPPARRQVAIRTSR